MRTSTSENVTKDGKTNMHKLHIIEESLFAKLPGVGEMMRGGDGKVNARRRGSACAITELHARERPSRRILRPGPPFIEGNKTERAEYEEMCQDLIGAWSSFGLMRTARGYDTPQLMPGKIHETVAKYSK